MRALLGVALAFLAASAAASGAATSGFTVSQAKQPRSKVTEFLEGGITTDLYLCVPSPAGRPGLIPMKNGGTMCSTGLPYYGSSIAPDKLTLLEIEPYGPSPRGRTFYRVTYSK